MITVFIPPQFRSLTDGAESVEVEATSVRQAIACLDERFPGIADRLCTVDELRPGLSVSVSGRVSGLGLFQKVAPGGEIHFLPAIGGG
ncbi:MAG: MoaD/ThiS family protein [Planctomycetota bacterium]|nr:MoaD/ThiS family protein [Planctomycetota bacterium]MDA1158528.1 MoaD/ThiS family protein [Planctomycetota bacterium]